MRDVEARDRKESMSSDYAVRNSPENVTDTPGFIRSRACRVRGDRLQAGAGRAPGASAGGEVEAGGCPASAHGSRGLTWLCKRLGFCSSFFPENCRLMNFLTPAVTNAIFPFFYLYVFCVSSLGQRCLYDLKGHERKENQGVP